MDNALQCTALQESEDARGLVMDTAIQQAAPEQPGKSFSNSQPCCATASENFTLSVESSDFHNAACKERHWELS